MSRFVVECFNDRIYSAQKSYGSLTMDLKYVELALVISTFNNSRKCIKWLTPKVQQRGEMIIVPMNMYWDYITFVPVYI